jgi:hypothetical protein
VPVCVCICVCVVSVIFSLSLWGVLLLSVRKHAFSAWVLNKEYTGTYLFFVCCVLCIVYSCNCFCVRLSSLLLSVFLFTFVCVGPFSVVCLFVCIFLFV